jgi:DNA-directed RNA polymerase specialized sigma24 family protein
MPWPHDFANWAEDAYPVVIGRVFHRLRRRLDPRRAADLAEESAQHALLKAAQRMAIPHYFTNEVHFTRWLVVVAYRYAVDRLRRERERAGDFADAPDPPPGLRFFSPAVWDALQRLPEEERRI